VDSNRLSPCVFAVTVTVLPAASAPDFEYVTVPVSAASVTTGALGLPASQTECETAGAIGTTLSGTTTSGVEGEPHDESSSPRNGKAWNSLPPRCWVRSPATQ